MNGQSVCPRETFSQCMSHIVYIRAVNLASLDLNLLVSLEALLTEAHVGRAAHRVGLSQPAMSHALRRLRELLEDPLLVRVGTRMELTPRAGTLHAPLADALDQLRRLFEPEVFEPARSRRRFRLMIPDVALDIVLTPLVQRITSEAPDVVLEVVPWEDPAFFTSDLARSLDLVISCHGDAYAGFHRQLIYRDSDALAARKGHPVGRRLKKFAAFLAARHVAVVSRGSQRDMIDEWLRRQGHERVVAVVTPSYVQALHVAAASDLVAFVPRRMIGALAGQLQLQCIDPPLDTGVDTQFLLYPAHAKLDPSSIWLRRHILEIGKELEGVRRRVS